MVLPIPISYFSAGIEIQVQSPVQAMGETVPAQKRLLLG